jgi:hypothetical protein
MIFSWMVKLWVVMGGVVETLPSHQRRVATAQFNIVMC